ncbi:hypothetical protein pdul_cds_386 [Pandoravirus dulcis]|uniref:F-box domain containing protein n=1 Tax=Pandoravirus dulcis TaxID=1349409 RepID=S4VQ21_9VIRU|nr:hypothetical protein pdul_cds_386 [Pandoravirus dulcis]AGO82423.1 hypothetical protein pdul_cds_386 [Pandoravirus dulcis]
MNGAFVVGGLPVELWQLVLDECDRADTARLGATCQSLRARVLDQRAHEIAAARSAVDAFVDRWETLTAKWDETWAPDAGTDAHTCALCTPKDRRDTADPRTDGGVPRRAWWICDAGAPGDGSADWICDVCAQAVRDHPGNADGLAWPMRRVDTTQPHVWSVMQFDGYAQDILPSGPVAQFRVPDAAIHLVDSRALDYVAAWPVPEPMLFFRDLLPSEMPSVRAWMPLIGAHVSPTDSRTIRMLAVCCDAQNNLWGAVILAEYDLAYSTGTWRGIEDSIETLMARHRRSRAVSPADTAVDLAMWTADAYADRPARAKRAERDRNGTSAEPVMSAIIRGDPSDTLMGKYFSD